MINIIVNNTTQIINKIKLEKVVFCGIEFYKDAKEM